VADDAAAHAIRAVKGLVSPGSGSLILAAEEDISLRDVTIAIQSTTGGWRYAKVIRFFRVFPAQYELSEDQVVGQQVYLDSEPEWVVAIVPTAMEVSGSLVLAGLEESQADANFNRLGQHLVLTAGSTERALTLFDYWLRVARGDRVRKRVVSDQLGAISVAAEQFRSVLSGRLALTRFQRWRQAQATRIASVRPPEATVANGYAVVRFWLFHNLRLDRVSVRFSVDGRIDEKGIAFPGRASASHLR
jgi:hypothetical protein